MSGRPWWREWGGFPPWLDPQPDRLRFRPLVGDEVWFGPRAWGGWGWTPVSWKGWVALLVHGLLVVAAVVVLPEPAGLVCTLVLTASLIATCVAKGTSPGGPSAWRHYRALRDQGRT